MKTEKELIARKEEVETPTGKNAELTADNLTQVSGGVDFAADTIEFSPEGHEQLYKCDHCGQTIHAPSDDPFFWFEKECHFCTQGHFKMA